VARIMTPVDIHRGHVLPIVLHPRCTATAVQDSEMNVHNTSGSRRQSAEQQKTPATSVR